MFSKTTNGAQPPRSPGPSAAPMDPQRVQAPPSARAPTRSASVLGPELVFEGSITGDGELMVDGAVKGDIHVARLMVGEHAHIEGNVRGGSIEIRGHIHGNIEGKAVRLFESAHVEGDITHEQLSIDVGAFFQGRCQQFRPAAAPAVQAPPPMQTASVLSAVPSEPHAEAPRAIEASRTPDAPRAQVIELDTAHRA